MGLKPSQVENWFSNKTKCEEECVDQGYNLRENSDGCKINTYLFEDECVALADELESCHVKVQS